MGPIVGIILKVLGQAALAALMSLLTGRTFRYILILPFRKLADWTGNPTEKKIVEEAQKDLGLDP